jgi:hypothetical protein
LVLNLQTYKSIILESKPNVTLGREVYEKEKAQYS